MDDRNITLSCDLDRINCFDSKDKTIHQLFEAQVAKTPKSIALVYQDQTITYKELNEKANQLAYYIRSTYKNINKTELKGDTLVALLLDRSIEMVISILAVLKSGAAYVPISPEFPQQRVDYILKDTQAQILISQSHLREKLNQLDSDLNVIYADSDYLNNPINNPNVQITSKNLAYVIYTSGTTGKPKGVVLEHQGIVNRIQWMQSINPLNAKDRVLHKTPYTFDVSVWELLWANWYGATIVIANPQGHKDCDYLYKEIVKNKVTITHFVPSMLDVFLEYLSSNKKNLQGLKTVFCSGEALKETTVNKFHKLAGDSKVKLYNLYGPTEASIDVSFSLCSLNKRVSMGRPIQNTKLYILDKDQKPVPIGVEGELYIGGAGLARGYLNLPELTQEKFIENPFATEKDKDLGYTRIYKTGDICKWRDNGEIEYIGRNDFQVKLRGFRIELGEIEKVISEIKEIQQICVVAKENKSSLVAYYTSSDKTITEDLIRAHIKDQLPKYMIPNAFIRLDKFPLTINGKLDRKALPDPQFISKDYIPPITATQKKLCKIWQKLLEVKKVGITDNFFELGGSSILAIRAALLISEKLNISLQVGDIFSFNTVEKLAKHLNDHLQKKVTIPITKNKLIPLSFAQQRLWFIEKYEQGTNAYHVPWLISLSDDIKIVSFVKAVQSILKRHKVLRTIFKANDKGESFQQVCDKELTFEEVCYSTKSELNQSLSVFVNKPFDLTKSYPIRLVVYKKSGRFTHALINIHHIAIDGWSRNIFADELLQYYEYFTKAKKPILKDLTIQYKDFAVWQREYLQKPDIKKQLDYWNQQLSGCQQLDFPIDKPRPNDFELVGLEIPFKLNKGLSIKLRNLAKHQGTTLYNMMLTGFYILLYKYTQQKDIIIGSLTANRNYPQIEDLIGFFVNSLILREKITASHTAKDLLEQVSNHLAEVQKYQDIPFEQLVEEISVSRDISKHPAFQVMFSVQNFEFQNSLEVSRYFKTESLHDIHAVTKFDLLVILNDAEAELSGTINYATSLFEKSTIERFINYYKEVLEQLVQNFDSKAIQHYELLVKSEYNKLIYDFNKTDFDYPKNKTIHQLFEEQVEKTPNNIALVYQDQAISYKNLNDKANQLAHHIRSSYKDVNNTELKADTLIALLLDRSIEMIVSILAVLKSGAAYVPISPEFPQQRIDYILKDTQSQILISQSHLEEKLNLLDSSLNIIYADSDYSSYPINNPNVQITSKNLAYVIYTSGTTGKPKGVMLEHGSFVSFTTLFSKKNICLKLDSIKLLSLTDYTFDIFGLEYTLPLIEGGYIVLSSIYTVNESELNMTNIAQQTPNVLSALCDKYKALLVNKIAFVGGEKSTQKTVGKLLSSFREVYNVFGPTETTIWSSIHLFKNPEEYSCIGKPLYNEKLYILGKDFNPVAVGIKGDLYIGGAGLARGYLNLPKLTKEKFIENPFATEKDKELGYTRLYKTGDICKWLDNGEIEYIGRDDFQIKLRGFRIELGEIENALNQLAPIKSAKVTSSCYNNNQSLIAYYTYDQNAIKDNNIDSTDHWAELYNDEYKNTKLSNGIDNDFIGWNSYITGKPFDVEEMHQWRNATIETIKNNNINNVFEIGVGSGLLLYKLLPYTQVYDGLDISQVVIDRHNQNVKSLDQHVNLFAGRADEIFKYSLNRPYNCVIINSVCQYFPNIKYFEQTIKDALEILALDGKIFIGDVRDYRHHKKLIKEKYNNQIDDYKATDIAFKESELLISPEYFLNLVKLIPGISVDILEKQGVYVNELNKYRYDVVIYKQSEAINTGLKYEFFDSISTNKLADKIKQVAFEKSALIVDGVTNPRLGSTNRQLYVYIALAKKLNLNFKLHRISSLGKNYLSCSFATKEIYTNDIFSELQINLDEIYNLPAQSSFSNEDIKQELKKIIPEYIIPNHFVRLDKFPLTINGKLDLKALPNPIISTEKIQIPTTPEQVKICKIWQTLLGIPQIGLDEDFFNIGGSSILAIQLAFQMSEAFNTSIAVADIFKYKTPRLLSKKIAQPNNIIRWLSEPDANKPLIIFVHPSCAGSEVYQSLADKLSQTYRCLGIDNYNLTQKDKITDLASLAKFYLSQLELKEKKIILLGWSLGGLIALEIAYWLEQKDFDVQVVLLDTFYPVKKSLVKSIFEKEFKSICHNMNLLNKDQQYIKELKHNYQIERQLSQSKLSGKINKSNIFSFNARGIRFRQFTSNIVFVKASHFNIIKKITSNWEVYKQAFVTGDFESFFKLKRRKYQLIYMFIFSMGIVLEEYTLGLFSVFEVLWSLDFIQTSAEGV